MNPMEDGSTINERLAELEQKLAALQAERATAAEQTHVHTSASPEKALGRKRESRRRLLGKGLGVAAAASLGAVALLDVGTGTALANGNESPTFFANNGANAIPVIASSTSANYAVVAASTGGNGIIGACSVPTAFGAVGVGAGTFAGGGAALGGFSNDATNTDVVAVYGNGQSGTGVYGTARTLNSGGTGVVGIGDSSFGTGVFGDANVGVLAQAEGSSGTGVLAFDSGIAGSKAGFFVGDVTVTGALSAGVKDFKIDHPLDPANKYLTHSCVESPDQKNVYDGVVTLDGQGAATVTLPAYFGALNKDFRYQLTAIGASGPNLYIAAGVSNNSFKIAGGTAGTQVSWQVTGSRQDAFALANPIVVEQNKSANERGRYLHPTLYGHAASESVVTLPKAAKRKPVAPYKVPVVPPIPGRR